MAAEARILPIAVPAVDTTTAFQIQFAAGGTQTWTGYDPNSISPSAPADIPVGELDSDLNYTLDGVNGDGNSETASQEGNWYQVRLKTGLLYGQWGAPFRLGAPTAQDMLLRLAAMGIDAGSADLNAAAADGLAYFETACGRRFLALSETRLFDLPEAPSRTVDFRDDCFGNPSALSVGGTAYVLNTGYRMMDPNTYLRGKPFWGVQFPSLYPGPMPSTWPAWNAISVTALWGYGLTIPNDLFDGMVLAGLLRLLPDLGTAATGVFNKWVEAEVTEDYGPETYGKPQDRMQAQIDRLAAKYSRRDRVGIGG